MAFNTTAELTNVGQGFDGLFSGLSAGGLYGFLLMIIIIAGIAGIFGAVVYVITQSVKKKLK